MIKADAGYRKLEGYHDSRLISVVHYPEEMQLDIKFQFVNEQYRTIQLYKCEIFRLHDFTSQNIVSRVMTFAGGNVDKQFIAERIRWATSLSDCSSYLQQDALKKKVEIISEGKVVLLIIEPSWGAELAALSEGLNEVVE